MKFLDVKKLQSQSMLRHCKKPKIAKVINMRTEKSEIREIIAEIKIKKKEPYIFYVHPEDRITITK